MENHNLAPLTKLERRELRTHYPVSICLASEIFQASSSYNKEWD